MNHTNNHDPIQRVLSRLQNVRQSGENQWEACCPSHDDHDPSLSVGRGENGEALLYCHSQRCPTEEIVGDLGLTLADLFPKNGQASPSKPKLPPKPKTLYPTREAATAAAVRQVDGGTFGAAWEYENPDGSLAFVVIRIEIPDDKEFRPIHEAAKGWVVGAPSQPYPLFGVTSLADAELVVVVEGERCCRAAQSLGYVATTSAFGSQSAGKSDWTSLGGKLVVIMPDNDEPGRHYAETVSKILTTMDHPARVKIVSLPGLDERGDIADFVAARECTDTCDIKRGIDELIADAPWFVSPQEDTSESQRDRAERISKKAEAARLRAEQKTAKPVREELEWRPFPLDVFTPTIQRILQNAAKSMDVDVSILALPVFIMLAGVIGNSRRLVLKRDWICPAILWGGIIGDSGCVKTPALRFGSRSLHRLYKRAVREHRDAMTNYNARLVEWKKDKEQNGDNAKTSKPKEPTIARVVIDNITTEAVIALLDENPRGLCVVRDELGGWVGGFDAYRAKGKNVDAATWEEFFNGGPVTNDRKGATKAERYRVYIPLSAVSVIGGIQPATMCRVLTREHFESGLVARILWVMPPERVRAWTDWEPPEQDEQDLDSIVDRLYELAPEWDADGAIKPKYIGMTIPAKRLFTKFYDEHNRITATLPSDLKASWVKIEGCVGRLALVIQLSRWAAGDTEAAPDKVDEVSMANAIRLAEWFGHENRRVYQMLADGFIGKDERELIRVVELLGGRATVRDIQRSASHFRGSADEIEAVLNQLVRTGRGEWTWEKTGGRQKQVFTAIQMTKGA